MAARRNGKARIQPWRHAFGELFWSLFGSLMPFWGSIVVIRCLGQWKSLVALSQHGEFAVYSAALLAPTVYLTVADFKIRPRAFLAAVGVPCLLLSAVFFVIVKLSEVGGLEFDYGFVANASLWVFLISILVFYLAKVSEHAGLVDIQKKREDDYDALVRNFRTLEGELDAEEK